MNISYINFDCEVENIKYKFNKSRKRKLFYTFLTIKKQLKKLIVIQEKINTKKVIMINYLNVQ